VVSDRPADSIAPLFVPADRPDRFAKAAASGADAVIIDLEDALAPDAKAEARDALVGLAPLPAPIFIRINSIDSEWAGDDIAVVAQLPIAAVVLPKTRSVVDIAALEPVVRRGIAVIAMIESAAGLAAARAIAAAAGVARLAFGSLDYAADLGMSHSRDALLTARAELVLASRLAGIAPPLDGVTQRIDDPGEVADDARHAAELGFGGKLCIHPNQVMPVVDAFIPTDGEIAWARKILGEAGEGIGFVGGEMIDAPVRLHAERILHRAERARRR